MVSLFLMVPFSTAFAVGATTVIDPQTGHYTAGLPIDPGFLSAPGLLTGIDNALMQSCFDTVDPDIKVDI
jgi:hypothetical protein